MNQVLKEAIVFGLLVLLAGLLAHFVYGMVQYHNMNDNVVYGAHLFVAGFVAVYLGRQIPNRYLF